MGVLAIGGLFFRAKDPHSLAAWYRDHLNVGAGCSAEGQGGGNEWVWMAEGGATVFAPFKADSDYFPLDRAFMLNLRVRDLKPLLARLEDAGIAAEVRAEWDDAGLGKFARIHDPEGNPIELWEAPAEG